MTLELHQLGLWSCISLVSGAASAWSARLLRCLRSPFELHPLAFFVASVRFLSFLTILEQAAGAFRPQLCAPVRSLCGRCASGAANTALRRITYYLLLSTTGTALFVAARMAEHTVHTFVTSLRYVFSCNFALIPPKPGGESGR